MKPYPVLKYPNAILRQKLEPVPSEMFGSPKLKERAARMTITMMRSHGIGLAANQVGFNQRMIVINTLKTPNGFSGTLINPEILEVFDQAEVGPEGCLSFPGETEYVHRPRHIKVKFYTVDGTERILEFKGLTAVCVQHEIDHLDGIVMKDRV